jgi:ankyrin repeat protein
MSSPHPFNAVSSRTPSLDDMVEAAKTGHIGTILALLQEGVSPDQKNRFGDTPLIWAAAKGRMDITLLLLDKGANVNETGYDRYTALMRAAESGHKKALNLLLSRGADTESKNKDGETALTLAEKSGFAEIAQILKDIAGEKASAVAAAKAAEEERIRRITDPALHRDIPAPKPLRFKPPSGKKP